MATLQFCKEFWVNIKPRRPQGVTIKATLPNILWSFEHPKANISQHWCCANMLCSFARGLMATFHLFTWGPCKRTQHCWPTTGNIGGPNILRPFAWKHNNVGTCWHLLRIKLVKLLGPCKRTQHCWPKTPNNRQQCCDLLHPFAWNHNVGTCWHLFQIVWNRSNF